MLVKYTKTTTYSEMSQPNPLRWQILHRKGNVLTTQTGKIKCKDFFNDIVAFRKAKKKFSIYRFNNDIKFNREGTYIELTGIANIDLFVHNVCVLNHKLDTDGLKRIAIPQMGIVNKSVIICVPTMLWASTYLVSLWSMAIRLCNYNKQYFVWKDFFAPDAPLNTLDKAFNEDAQHLAEKWGFKVPKQFKGFWYYAPFGYNNKEHEGVDPSTIHNNGVCNWAFALKTKGM